MGNKLPKNWEIVPLEAVGENKYYAIGDGDHGKIKPSMYQDNGIPYIRVSDIDWGYFKKEKLVYISEEVHNINLKSELVPGDVLIAKTGATIGKCCIVPKYIEKANTTSSVGKVSINKALTSSKWVLYYFLSSEFFKLMWSHSNRTAQPGFNNIDLKKFPLPLPPIAEQERIIAKLDALFAQHEAMKKALERIPQLLKDFRQQVLTQAVTGKLTEEWRKDNKFGNTELFKLNDICDSITDGDHQAPPQVAEGIPFLVISNVSKGVFNFESVNRFVPIEYFQNLKSTRVPKICDILYTVTGSYGIALLVDFNKKFCFQRHIAILRPNVEVVNPTYLTYFLNSTVGKTQADEMATGTAQLTVSLTSIKGFKIELPNIKEQNEIVSRVKSLFQSADIIENKYLKLKQKNNSLPQAILHKAFIGELVEQLPTDGNARDLLEEIKKLKLKH